MRIAIVNDLMMAVEILRRIILSVPGHEIAWVAHDGEEAVEKCLRDTPDLILMDLMMPKMDGVEATRRIMADSPCPILVVTATVGNNAAQVFDAMGRGALDAVNVPVMGSGAEAERSRYTLLRKIHVISRLRGVTPSSAHAPRMERDPFPSIIVIGSSTGGPRALARILSALPGDLDAVIVIVQHVDEKFSAGLADWLDGQTSLKVRLVAEGSQPRTNRVHVAGTNDHLVFTPALTFSYTPEPGSVSYRPSVDVFFQSVAKYWPKADHCRGNIAILLTGMGKDGAAGLADLRRAGWHTIAQDKSSSVVYGMPKAAKELGAAREVLALEDIAPAILKRLNRFGGFLSKDKR